VGCPVLSEKRQELRSAFVGVTQPCTVECYHADLLAEAANTAVQALRLLADTISKNDPISGNAADIGSATAKEIGVLCTRLVP
jgi:hypothetical protein